MSALGNRVNGMNTKSATEVVAKLPQRIASRVVFENECAIWTGKSFVVSVANKRHRLSHFFWDKSGKGKLPARTYIKQSCGKSRCVNPEHLYRTSAPAKATSAIAYAKKPVATLNANQIALLLSLAQREINNLVGKPMLSRADIDSATEMLGLIEVLQDQR